MNLFILAWSYLKARPLTTVLNVVLLALGIAVVSILIVFSRQLEEKIAANTRGVDLVVGARGSPMQLILCSVFHVDFPTGNINLAEAERIARHPMVKNAIPMAIGDSYQGYRIAGTRIDYAELYGGQLAEGTWWEKHLEVTAGAEAAERLMLVVGSEFVSAHGLTDATHAHEAHHYRVVGILKRSNTVLDNLLLTNVQSLWLAHDIEVNEEKVTMESRLVPKHAAGDSTKEITSLLIQFRNPLAALQLPRYVNGKGNFQAASPAFETARLFSILGVGADVLRAFAGVLILISGLSIFIVLYNSMKERRYDLAIMRSMGSSRTKLFLAVVLEGTWLTALGSSCGLVLGHLALFAFARVISGSGTMGLEPWAFYTEEGVLLAGSLALGVVCSVLPALQAYRTDIHEVLAGN